MCWLEPPVKCWIKIVIIDVSVNNCLVPDVRRKTFNLLPLSKMLPLSFSLSSFIRWEKSSSISYILKNFLIIRCSVQFSSVTQSCPTLWDPTNHSSPGLPVHQQLPEFTQTHVHRVGDAIQPSHPLLSPSPPAPNPSQYQSLFQWVNSSHEVAKVLEFQL